MFKFAMATSHLGNTTVRGICGQPLIGITGRCSLNDPTNGDIIHPPQGSGFKEVAGS
jgi:hypothetical protein